MQTNLRSLAREFFEFLDESILEIQNLESSDESTAGTNLHQLETYKAEALFAVGLIEKQELLKR